LQAPAVSGSRHARERAGRRPGILRYRARMATPMHIDTDGFDDTLVGATLDHALR